MYGAVLWCDTKSERALIWCEDHADLAFFDSECRSSSALEPGDLVRFELVETDTLRVAIDLEIVAADEYPTLATELQQACDPSAAVQSFIADCAPCNNVVAFVPAARVAARPDETVLRQVRA